MPRGVWFAIALAIVVMAIAVLQATSSTTAGDRTAVLDNGISPPSGGANGLERPANERVGTVVPSTEITGFDGEPLRLSDYAGRPLVVNFWAVNCLPCRTEMPDFEQVHRRLGDRVAFLGVDTGESIEIGRPFAEDLGISYDLASDPQGALIGAFAASVLPTTVLVRPDGTITRIRTGGVVTADELQTWIEQDLVS